MVSINTNYGSSPAVTSMFDSTKGSLGNRIDCTMHRAANTARATAETGALCAGTYAGYKIINKATKGVKDFKWNKSINNALKKSANLYKKVGTSIAKEASNLNGLKKIAVKTAGGCVNLLKSAFEKLAKTSGKQKLLGLLGMVALGTLINIERKHAYKEGQYDEKYTIRAKVCNA